MAQIAAQLEEKAKLDEEKAEQRKQVGVYTDVFTNTRKFLYCRLKLSD